MLKDIDRAGAKTPLCKWSLTGAGGVTVSIGQAVEQARPVAAADGIELDAELLTLATVINSEDGAANAITMAVIGDATVNRARSKSRSIVDDATRGHGYGRQGASRPVSTARAPTLRHLRVAVEVMRGEAAGISRDARSWLHWRTQNRMAASKPATNCPALTILERWAFSCPWDGHCRLGPRGAPALEWVGPIDGVDHGRVLFFRPATAAHAAQYEAARQLLSAGGSKRPALAALAVPCAVLALGGVL